MKIISHFPLYKKKKTLQNPFSMNLMFIYKMKMMKMKLE